MISIKELKEWLDHQDPEGVAGIDPDTLELVARDHDSQGVENLLPVGLLPALED